MKAKGKVKFNVNKIHRRRRKDGEYASPMKAIRMHCLECCGYMQSEVTNCTGEKCWLYPLRTGTRACV